jgi:carboxylesterase type B
VPHGAEISPLFQNVDGLGYEQNAFTSKGQGYHDMSRLIGTMWVGFIIAMDPNIGLKEHEIRWLRYKIEKLQNFVFDYCSGLC